MWPSVRTFAIAIFFFLPAFVFGAEPDGEISASAIAIPCEPTIVAREKSDVADLAPLAIDPCTGEITPGRPASITYPSTSSNGTYDVAWGAAIDAQRYWLYESLNGAANTTVGSVASTSARQWSFTGKPAGNYIYTVEACADYCGASRSGGTLTVTLPPTPPTINFSASPGSIVTGGSASLSWSTTNATSCALDGLSVAINGSQSTGSLSATKAYTLACSGAGGSNSASSTVTVIDPPTATISASPTSVLQGGSATLTWSSSGANSCTLDGASVSLGGSKSTGAVNSTQSFSLNYINSVATVTVNAVVTVIDKPAISFSASPTSVPYNGESTLTWAVTNATNCALDNGIGSVSTSGSRSTGNLTIAKTYNLSCTGAGGSSSKVVTVAVGQNPATIVSDSRIRGLAWLISHQQGDGAWRTGPGSDVPVTSVALQALTNAKIGGYSTSAAVALLGSSNAYSVDAQARRANALMLAGADASRYLSVLTQQLGGQQTWGTYSAFDHSNMDTALATIALRDANASYPGYANAACKLVTNQNSMDFGWSYVQTRDIANSPSSQLTSSVIPTVYVLQAINRLKALAPSYSCTEQSYALQTILDSGINGLISNKLKPDGSFGDGSSGTILETALVHELLRVTRPTDAVTTSALNYLATNQTLVSGSAYGSWGLDAYITAQVLRSYPTLDTPLSDVDSDGVPDLVELQLGTNPSVADSRYLATGNGTSMAGTNSVQRLPNAYTGQAYAYSLPSGTGTSPFAWRLAGGQLPNGLSLKPANGSVYGTPTMVQDPTNFIYQVTDATSKSTLVLAQIKVLQGGGTSESSLGSGINATALTVKPVGGSVTQGAAAIRHYYLIGGDWNVSGIRRAIESLFDSATLRIYRSKDDDERVYVGRTLATDYSTFLPYIAIHYRAMPDIAVRTNALVSRAPLSFMSISAKNCDVGNSPAVCGSEVIAAVPDALISELPVKGNLAAFCHGVPCDAVGRLRALALPEVTFGLAVTGNDIVNIARAEAFRLLSSENDRLKCVDSMLLAGAIAGGQATCRGPIAKSMERHVNAASCLESATREKTSAIGLLSIDHVPTNSSSWHWLAIDGVLPGADAGSLNRYGWVLPSTLLWRPMASDSAPNAEAIWIELTRNALFYAGGQPDVTLTPQDVKVDQISQCRADDVADKKRKVKEAQ
ncbi:hypothetical protein HPT27_05315 [Permianibacter sp. IMCC34836]|uniref:putative Ig domain-containing protein n=1 Tax=Permianibacter fluminis TaxID=2738515 RepID=UPI001551FE9D|nr:putative Ig domain-containing protein [Permianibacter fluminis]NQD36437.1 hypothetical protein [Permianibacter fluminis]